MPLPWLDPIDAPIFPCTSRALAEPNGLLAAGGSLDADWLLAAYSQGIFPWYEQGQPLLWWSPDPRLVLEPDRIVVSRSLRKLIRKQIYRISFDTAFLSVICACQFSGARTNSTWITPEMRAAYVNLHQLGHAHSVEVWHDELLVGGLYGIALGKAFFGESMFSARANASKLALVALSRHLQAEGFGLIDCQVHSDHLVSMGAEEISRRDFQEKLSALLSREERPGAWKTPPNDLLENPR
ncbi:MAG: leucyl/phenylalanyl-tRNA--protein transferase [Pseudomonadota bacterium]|nr:leucyl/phenylalanyl-tRNA--protein transferase [Pseudomonadota bacterium]